MAKDNRLAKWNTRTASGRTVGEQFASGANVGLRDFIKRNWEAVYAEDAYLLPQAWLSEIRRTENYKGARALVRHGRLIPDAANATRQAKLRDAAAYIDSLLESLLPRRGASPAVALSKTDPVPMDRLAATLAPTSSPQTLASEPQSQPPSPASPAQPQGQDEPAKPRNYWLIAGIASAVIVALGVYWRLK